MTRRVRSLSIGAFRAGSEPTQLREHRGVLLVARRLPPRAPELDVDVRLEDGLQAGPLAGALPQARVARVDLDRRQKAGPRPRLKNRGLDEEPRGLLLLAPGLRGATRAQHVQAQRGHGSDDVRGWAQVVLERAEHLERGRERLGERGEKRAERGGLQKRRVL